MESKYIKFIKNNLSSLNRNRRKKQVINSVLESFQSNDSVINIHRVDNANIGDYYCAPHLYFDELKNKQLDIYDYKNADPIIVKNWKDKVSKNSLIIGGGGLLNRNSFELQIKLFEELSKKGKKTVIWGAGHNAKKKNHYQKEINYNIDIKNFDIVGTRDYTNQGDWVPCVSCMNSVFDKKYNISQETGIIFHKKTLKNKSLLNKLNNYPCTSNTTNLDDLVKFIGQSEKIVTNSYHAMYWAMLLNKKVIVIPNSSKFFDFKYQPIFSTFEDFEKKLKQPQSYSGVLEECREVNMQFAEKVFDFLNI